MEILSYVLILNLSVYVYFKTKGLEEKIISLQEEIEKNKKQIGGLHKRINIEK